MAEETASEIEPTLDLDAGFLQRLRRDLAEDDLLGEVLGADMDRLVRTRAGTRDGNRRRDRRREKARAFHRLGPRRFSIAPRPKSKASARSAAGSAPARISRWSAVATPR